MEVHQISAAELAARIGVHKETIGATERCRPISDVLIHRLAKALDVKVQDIASPPAEDDEENPAALGELKPPPQQRRGQSGDYPLIVTKRQRGLPEVTTEPGGATAPASHIDTYTTAYGLSPGDIALMHDEHGAAHIRLGPRGTIDIRIQVDPGAYDTPEQHAAELERDRQALLRLAGECIQLAAEIAQRQEGGTS